VEPVIPDFTGKAIEIIKISGAVFLWTTDNWEIRLAGPVVVTGGDAAPVTIDVDDPAEVPLPPELAGLVGATITQLLVTEEGHLVLQLPDRQLLAQAAADYEAWQIAGHDGELLICTPGGDLTYFPPVPGIGTPRGTGPAPAEDTPSTPAS
jgi:Family of unknown function (DUF6188)